MTSALETIRYHSGIAGEEVADMVDSLEREVSSLREQVEKLTKERDALVDAIDNEMVVTHMGVFNPGDDPKVALNKICCYAQDLGKFFAEDACKEQLLALAEQNEKMRKALTKWRYLDGSYNWRCGHCGNEEGDEHKEGCALSLPDLATPVLNRIKAEAYREAAEIVGPEDSYQDDWFKAKADSCAKLLAKADVVASVNAIHALLETMQEDKP